MTSTFSLVLALAFLVVSSFSASVPEPDAAPPPPTKVARQASSTNGSSTLELQQLSMGIGLNIMAAQGQMAVANMIQSLNQASPTPNSTFFQAAKDDLIGFLNAGMRARANNVKISSNTQITRGLIQVEEGQILQLALVNNLTGDPAQDGDKIQDLQQRISATMSLNSQLQALANGSSVTGPLS